MQPRAECSTNVLYFNAFMDLYKDRFNIDDWSKIKKGMKLRASRMDIATNHATCKERHWFNRINIQLSLNALASALVATTVSIIQLL